MACETNHTTDSISEFKKKYYGLRLIIVFVPPSPFFAGPVTSSKADVIAYGIQNHPSHEHSWVSAISLHVCRTIYPNWLNGGGGGGSQWPLTELMNSKFLCVTWESRQSRYVVGGFLPGLPTL